MTTHERARAEWLETDGLGGFASGTVDGIRTRRYHALLLCAATPPTGRLVLVNGFEAWVETPDGRFPVSSQNYGGPDGDVVHPEGYAHRAGFTAEPWPTWQYDFGSGVQLEHQAVVRNGLPVTLLSWKLAGALATPPAGSTTLCVRLLHSGRDSHALHHENAAFRFDPVRHDHQIVWQAYDGVTPVAVLSNGQYTPDPAWFRNFVYEEERARGLDFVEDLASPGIFRFDISRREAILLLAAVTPETDALLRDEAPAIATYLRACERERRAAFPSPLHRSADAYLVKRGTGKSIVAGYPWFTDWGRDTFIALRGLCLATGRVDDARDILLEWADAVSEGLMPNRFADHGGQPEFNSVDASLWYVIAVAEFGRAAKAAGTKVSTPETRTLQKVVKSILTAYAGGTRYGIRMDTDGLLGAGEPGWQVTWMDAKAGDWVVTPRIGKPVEVQALWLNALWFGSAFADRWRRLYVMACESFEARFWNESAGHLYDVVDVDHVPGAVDATCRPNQIFAIGGLPVSLLDGKRARRVVDAVEQRLWTPLGLRSLAPGEPGYRAHYEGGPLERDAAYHHGTVWPWLTGAFVDAWVRVRGATPEAKREARERFLAPLLEHLNAAGLGHVSEIADAEAPQTPRGCPFQAWSVGELLRLREGILASEAALPRPPRHGLPDSVRSSAAMLFT